MSVVVSDIALQDLARMFFDDPKQPTPGSQTIDKSMLDYSVQSLTHVEQYLDNIRRQKLADKDVTIVVLRSGAYVGEVIRRHAKTKQWHWLDYGEACKLDAKIVSFGRVAGTAAVLWDSRKGFCFPLSKVQKYLQNGAGDSVRFFADAVIAEPSS